MGRWARSKQLATASWGVLRSEKELLVLPLISGIASLAVAATFLIPIGLASKATDSAGSTTLEPNVLSYLGLFAMYLVLAYVAIFFKTALLFGADERMRGGDASLGSALSGASSNAGRILPWAIVTATVSVILRSLEDRAGFLGRLVIGLVGLAWAVVTFLVLPVMVFEQITVGKAIKRSASLLKQTWGENLIVNAGIGLIALVLMLPAFLLVGVGIASGSVAVAVALVAVAVAVVWMIAVSCWSSAMTAVFQLALYRYATQASLPAEFAAVDLAGAISQRGTRGALGFGG